MRNESMKTDTRRRIADVIMWRLGLAPGAQNVAQAAASEHRFNAASNERWRSECGSCNVPYPPALLGAQSWRTIMAGLEHHFGSDASVEPDAAREIGAFLERNAGRERRAADGATSLRITETPWFVGEHAEHGALSSGVKPSDCGACHRGAAGGDYGKRTLRPAGAR
jgi:hypothetical protein